MGECKVYQGVVVNVRSTVSDRLELANGSLVRAVKNKDITIRERDKQ